MGATPVTEIVWPRISREGVANTHFSKLITIPLAAKHVDLVDHLVDLVNHLVDLVEHLVDLVDHLVDLLTT